MSGDQWSETIVISKTKLNQMSIISGLSSYLSGLPNVKNQVHLPEDTGNGYTAYNLSAWDGSARKNLSNPIHNHSSSTSGGDQAQMAYGNPRVIDTNHLWMTFLDVLAWKITADSGCSIAIDTSTTPDSLKITTGTTINTRAYANLDNLIVRFDDPLFFMTMVHFNTAISSMVWNFGYEAENVGDAGSGSLKALFEYCSAVNSNYFIASADGTTRTASDTGVALDTTNDRMLRFLVTPNSKTDWKIAGTLGIKSTNVPDTGNSPDRVGVVKTGQKVTAGTAGKSVSYWGCRLVYTVGEILQ